MTDRVEREFLPFVRKPGRYIGGEINQIRKDLSQCELAVALCFPDIYEVGVLPNRGVVEVRARKDVEDQIRIACDIAKARFRTKMK